jgi:EamA-like transporter family
VCAGDSPLGVRRGLLVLRGSLGYASITCFFLACQRLPLADATTLTFLAPLVAASLSPWVLAERPGVAAAVAIPACLAGVLLLTQPSFVFGGGGARLSGTGLAFGLMQPLFSASAKVRGLCPHPAKDRPWRQIQQTCALRGSLQRLGMSASLLPGRVAPEPMADTERPCCRWSCGC